MLTLRQNTHVSETAIPFFSAEADGLGDDIGAYVVVDPLEVKLDVHVYV